MTKPLNNAAAPGGNKARKLAMQTVVGAIVGAGVTYGLLSVVGETGFESNDPSRLVALVAGIVFALMGLVVGFGTLAPKPGAHLLNVEDADELRDQRRPLWLASMVMLLVGCAMLALVLAAVGGSDGIFSRDVAGILVAVCIIGVAGLSFASRGDNDELMQAVGTESSAVAMYATFSIFGIWAALSHLGYAAWIDPLGLLAALLLVELAAIFWVSARRGLLRQR